MKSAFLGGAALMALALPQIASAQDATTDDQSVLNDVIVVTSSKSRTQSDEIEPPHEIALPADSVSIASRAPGGASIGNGAVSGQLAYRGLFGERVLGRVNGQRFASGGPNAMDPPMHYAPSILVDHIEIARGVASVSQGPSLAGAVNAELQQVPYGSDASIGVHGSFGAQYRSVDDSYAVGGTLGVSTESWRLGAIASREEGDDYQFKGGTVGASSYERSLYGARGAVRLGEGELFAEYRRSETDPSGNPAFPMDIQYVDTDFVQAGYRGEINDTLAASFVVGHVQVHHLMNNYSLRDPDPMPAMFRATYADAETNTAEGSLRFGTPTRNVTVGADVESIDKYARITNPNNANSFVEAQPDVESERYGGFLQLRNALGAAEFELGARIDRTRQSSGIPELGSALPMGAVNLANAFIATPRKVSDTTVDAVLRVWLPGDGITPRMTLAHKTRVPTMLERFGWLPTSASFGLADGNVYVGNQALKPEEAWIAEAGLDVKTGAVTFRPTLFYRRVDDYIQGTPFDDTPGVIDSTVEMVANMNGDSTPLMYSNVDAELYGLDFDFNAQLTDHFFLDGTGSWIRAKRRDIKDNLYRVAPPNLRLAAIWQEARWSLGAEMQASADQNHVSATNGETPSDGYAVFGVFGHFQLTDAVGLDAGVENIFDAYYQPHLAGLNRVGDSDVPIGERLPGAGRGVWVRASASF